MAELPQLRYKKTSPRAISPSKKSDDDEGYDLHLIDIDKKINENTTRFDTGIAIEPPKGWYVEIVPRSSLSNYGYVMTNSIGIIDTGYRGSIKVTLSKISNSVSPIVLPFKGVQMLLKPHVHFGVEQVDSLSESERNEGSFGSTDTTNVTHEVDLEVERTNGAREAGPLEGQRSCPSSFSTGSPDPTHCNGPVCFI